MRSGARGSNDVRLTRPRERGFIRKTAALISQPCSPGSTAGKKNRVAPARANADLRHEDRVNRGEPVRLRLQQVAGLPAEVDADVVEQAPSPTGSASPSPLRRRIGLPYAPAASTIVAAWRSPRSVTTQPGSILSTRVSARIARFGRDRAASRYANAAFQRTRPTALAGWRMASSPQTSANAPCQGESSSRAKRRTRNASRARSR